jgi:hypothetical protein
MVDSEQESPVTPLKRTKDSTASNSNRMATKQDKVKIEIDKGESVWQDVASDAAFHVIRKGNK